MVQNYYNDAAGKYPFPTVGLRDVDKSVYDYFNERLNLTVEGPEGRKKVSAILASGERWANIRDTRGIRDENKTLILPLVTIQRLDVDRTLGFHALGAETPNIVISKKVHPKTNFIQNNLEQRNKLFPVERKNKIVYEILSIPFPDISIVYYQILFWAQQMQQMNEMLEKVFYMYDYMDSWVMPINYDKNEPSITGKHGYFIGFRETPTLSSQNNFEEFTDDERIIRYQYNIKVPAWFVLDPKDKPLSYGKERMGSPNDSGKHIVYKQQSANDILVETRNEKIYTQEEVAKLFNIWI